MSPSAIMGNRGWIRQAVLLGLLFTTAGALALWKSASLKASAAASSHQPEPMEVVTAATAVERQDRPTTVVIGTVRALQSITLRNELAGTVSKVSLVPGAIVDSGAVLVALDVSVEQAELEAGQAQAALAHTTLERLNRLRGSQATSEEEVDQARAQEQVAEANVARIRAVIARKTIRAPFRSRVGIADVHPGQYLNEGTSLTTLQGVDQAVNIDFAVAQDVASTLRPGQRVDIVAEASQRPIGASIVAVDSRVDSTTRTAIVRARVSDAAISPGASVRVQVPVGPTMNAVAVPATALRRGPGGDQVYVLITDSTGRTRAHARPVQAGDLLGDEVVLLAGVHPGERVAASGSFKLRDGELVQASAPAAANGSH